MKYRPEIDGLRALAVLPVLFFHAGYDFFSGGYIGVDIFFVISGFLITSILHQQIQAGSFSLYHFYARRARRLLPALASVLLVTIGLSWWILLPRELKDFAESLTAVGVFSSNILFWIESGYFDASAEFKPLLHTWSLAIEEQYYLVFPLMLMAIWRWAKRYLNSILITLMLLSLVYAEYLVGRQASAAFYLLPTRAWELLLGAVSALLLQNKVYLNLNEDQPKLSHSSQQTLVHDLLSMLGLLAILYSILYFTPETPTPSLITLIPTIGTALVLCFAQQGTCVYLFLSQPIFVGVGLISYSLYLWHQPLFALYKYRYHHLEQDPSWSALILILSTVLAYVSWRWVEKPFRDKTVPQYLSSPYTVIGFSFVLIGLGVIGHLSQGFRQVKLITYNPKQAVIIQQLSDDPYYVSQRWHHMKELQDFESMTGDSTGNAAKPKTKVMLIGDSYAQDLLNAIYEVGLDQKYQFSLYHISARCGNIWTSQDLSKHLSVKDFPCHTHPRYQEPTLQKRLAESEEIWLASSWRLWQVSYLSETIEKLKKFKAIRLRVFGRKAFGPVSFYAYQDNPQQFMIAELPQDHLEVNRAMKQIVPQNLFVDISQLMCASSDPQQDRDKCYHRLENGKLISFDGKHLSRVGAHYLGKKLSSLLIK